MSLHLNIPVQQGAKSACFFCKGETRLETALRGRAEQVPCCFSCAAERTVAEIPGEARGRRDEIDRRKQEKRSQRRLVKQARAALSIAGLFSGRGPTLAKAIRAASAISSLREEE